MPRFLAAHGYDPGPTQRPLLAGAISGLAATAPAIALLHLFGSIEVEARIVGTSVVGVITAGLAIMALAGAAYSRLFGRAANDRRGGWLFGMAFGFLLWAIGTVLVLPIVSGGCAPAGKAATGIFLSLVLWGGALGFVLPLLHRRFHQTIEDAARRPERGPSAAVSRRRPG